MCRPSQWEGQDASQRSEIAISVFKVLESHAQMRRASLRSVRPTLCPTATHSSDRLARRRLCTVMVQPRRPRRRK